MGLGLGLGLGLDLPRRDDLGLAEGRAHGRVGVVDVLHVELGRQHAQLRADLPHRLAAPLLPAEEMQMLLRIAEHVISRDELDQRGLAWLGLGLGLELGLGLGLRLGLGL